MEYNALICQRQLQHQFYFYQAPAFLSYIFNIFKIDSINQQRECQKSCYVDRTSKEG